MSYEKIVYFASNDYTTSPESSSDSSRESCGIRMAPALF